MRDDVPERAGRREWAGLAVLALPTMLIGLDMTVLQLAAPLSARACGRAVPSCCGLSISMASWSPVS